MVDRATLILLPGLDGTDIFFHPLLAALPDWIDARCVQYDAAGPHDYVELLPIIRDACRDHKNYFVLGWSFSGPLALMLAADPPPGLRGVVLCATFISAPWPLIRFFRRAATPSLTRLFPLLSEALAVFGRYSSDQFREDRAECWSRVPPSTLAARARTILCMDRRWRLQCHIPLLYVRGSADIVVPRWNARAVSRAIPSTRIVTIDGPHLALYTNPVKAADVIAHFVRQHA